MHLRRIVGLVAIGTLAAVAVYCLMSLAPQLQIKMAIVFRKQQSVQTPYTTDHSQGHVEPTAITELKKNPTVAPNSAPKVKSEVVNTAVLKTRARMEVARRERELSKKVPFTKDTSFKESTCPVKASSIAKYSTWFRQRYKPNIKLFLDRDDLKNSNNMSKFPLPFGINKNDFDLLHKIVTHPNFRNTSAHLGGTRKECLRCAVVGCGGVLKGSGAGPEIDSHDYVFRLNHAYTKTFEEDVGKRTSLYIFFPESMSALQHPLDKDGKFILVMFKVFDMNYALNMLSGKGVPRVVKRLEIETPNVDPTQIRIAHPDFIRYVATEYLNGSEYRPTTGAIATILALHLCDEVSLYGFGYDHRFSHHYYDRHFIKHANHMTLEHDVESERSIWYKLNEEGVIRLLKRDIV